MCGKLNSLPIWHIDLPLGLTPTSSQSISPFYTSFACTSRLRMPSSLYRTNSFSSNLFCLPFVFFHVYPPLFSIILVSIKSLIHHACTLRWIKSTPEDSHYLFGYHHLLTPLGNLEFLISRPLMNTRVQECLCVPATNLLNPISLNHVSHSPLWFTIAHTLASYFVDVVVLSFWLRSARSSTLRTILIYGMTFGWGVVPFSQPFSDSLVYVSIVVVFFTFGPSPT